MILRAAERKPCLLADSAAFFLSIITFRRISAEILECVLRSVRLGDDATVVNLTAAFACKHLQCATIYAHPSADRHPATRALTLVPTK